MTQRYCSFCLAILLAAASLLPAAATVRLVREHESPEFFNLDLVFVRDFTVDGRGNVYLLDSRTQRVVKLDAKLKASGSFAKKGEGPGEIMTATAVSCDPAGRIYIQDAVKKLSVFSNDGSHLRDIKIAGLGMINTAKVLSSHIFFGRVLSADGITAAVFDTDSSEKLLSYPLRDRDFVLHTNDGRMMAFHADFIGRSLILDEWQGHGVAAETQHFWIKLFNNEGKEVLTLEKEQPRRRITTAEMDYLSTKIHDRFNGRIARNDIHKAIENYKLFNIIQAVRLADNRIYVFLVPDDIAEENHFPADVYDYTGTLLRHDIFPVIPGKIVGSSAYIIESDDREDTQKLVRYRIEAE